MKRLALTGLLAVAAVVSAEPAAAQAAVVSAGPAAAQAPPGARLEGTFAMTGRVTVAVNVGRERSGQPVRRQWQFTPLCPRGACATITLVRRRATGSDRLTLHRRAPHFYTGAGTFYAPLRCAGRSYPTGEKVPFTITVRVTAGTVTGAGTFATAISATYVNRSRINLTPCVGVFGHDAASYRGVPVVAPAPSGGGPTSAGT